MAFSGRTLEEKVDALADEARGIRSELRTRTMQLWFAIVVGGVLLGVTILAAYSVTLDNRAAIATNNRRWCPLLTTLSPRPNDPPPAGNPDQVARGLRVRDGLTGLSRSFGCTS